MQPVPKCKKFTRSKNDPEFPLTKDMDDSVTFGPVCLIAIIKYHAEYAIDVHVPKPNDRNMAWITGCRDKGQDAKTKVTSGAEEKVPTPEMTIITPPRHPSPPTRASGACKPTNQSPHCHKQQRGATLRTQREQPFLRVINLQTPK